MRPRKRYLKGNAGTEAPTSLLFFDTESNKHLDPSNPNRQILTHRLWVAAHVRRDGPKWREPIYYQGDTAASFWSLVERLQTWKKPLWAFAHNLGHDLTQLDFWSQLEAFRWTAGPIARQPHPKTGKERPPWRGSLCLQGRPTFLIVRGCNGTLKLVDTGNYWPTSLSKIGERLGVPKLPMPAFTAPDADWFQYCRRDVDVARVAVCDLIDRWCQEDCGVFKLTAASLSLTNFQHTATCKVKGSEAVNIVLEDSSPSRGLERGAYLGGRIEPFFIGHFAEPVYYFDCNSLYPSVMRSNLYPRCRGHRMTGCKPQALRRAMLCHGAVADVLIQTGKSYDSYPLKAERNQVHASGRFWTTLCGPELLRALVAGHVERVGECYLYSLARIFAGWSDRWLAKRAECAAAGDIGGAEFAKLIGNSLAGKFGQRGDWWIDDKKLGRRKGWSRGFDIWPETGEWSELRWVAGHGQRRVRGKESANAFPIIAAYVTAYGREHMRSAFGTLPQGSLLYTATDSIVTTRAGHDSLIEAGLVDEHAPGKFRLEGIFPDADILGPNYYRVGDKWKISGLHGRAFHTPDGEAFAEVWDDLPSLMGANPHGRAGIELIPLNKLMSHQKNDDAGDGWRRPFRLSCDHEFTDRPPRLRERPATA